MKRFYFAYRKKGHAVVTVETGVQHSNTTLTPCASRKQGEEMQIAPLAALGDAQTEIPLPSLGEGGALILGAG